jgi:hypothetical protein
MESIETVVDTESSAPSLREARKRAPVHKMHAQDTWDNYSAEDIKDRPWVRPTSLAAPPPRPGFVQRWIRVATHGVDDPANATRRFREGWKPRPADSIPANFPLPTISNGAYAGCIGIEGSILCEMPDKLVKKRNKYYADKTMAIDKAIEEELQRDSSDKMPITQKRSSDSKIVRRPRVADDE